MGFFILWEPQMAVENIIQEEQDAEYFERLFKKFMTLPNAIKGSISMVSQLIPHDLIEDAEIADFPGTNIQLGQRVTIKGRSCTYMGEYDGDNQEYQGKRLFGYVLEPWSSDNWCQYSYNDLNFVLKSKPEGFILPDLDLITVATENLGSFALDDENPIIEYAAEQGFNYSMIDPETEEQCGACTFWIDQQQEGQPNVFDACSGESYVFPTGQDFSEEDISDIGYSPEDVPGNCEEYEGGYYRHAIMFICVQDVTIYFTYPAVD